MRWSENETFEEYAVFDEISHDDSTVTDYCGPVHTEEERKGILHIKHISLALQPFKPSTLQPNVQWCLPQAHTEKRFSVESSNQIHFYQ